MPTCSECRHYRPIDAETGLCFGHQVGFDQDVSECPSDSFAPVKEQEGKE